MNEDFLSDYKRIIREANYDNTYKMAWAKAIVELSNSYLDNRDEMISIPFSDIAKKILKYYWNQTIFFHLVQGSNLNKKPSILQFTEHLIELYHHRRGSVQPEFFERAEDQFFQLGIVQEYEETMIKIQKTLKLDVSWRFLLLNGCSLNHIYRYHRGEDYIIMNKDDLGMLAYHQQDLFDLINYRWSLILETFNSSPRINKKVRIMDEREIKRSPLNKFKKYLEYENPDHVCFICGKRIEEDKLSIDHIIPWSYLYSDDLWNFVYVHKECNSRKSNHIPSLFDIDKLKERNTKLLQLLETYCMKDNVVEDLRIANGKEYVDKFWIGSRA